MGVLYFAILVRKFQGCCKWCKNCSVRKLAMARWILETVNGGLLSYAMGAITKTHSSELIFRISSIILLFLNMQINFHFPHFPCRFVSIISVISKVLYGTTSCITTIIEVPFLKEVNHVGPVGKYTSCFIRERKR